MRRKWTVILVNEDRTWSLPIGTFFRRKNALDYAVNVLECVEYSGYSEEGVEVVVEWMG